MSPERSYVARSCSLACSGNKWPAPGESKGIHPVAGQASTPRGLECFTPVGQIPRASRIGRTPAAETFGNGVEAAFFGEEHGFEELAVPDQGPVLPENRLLGGFVEEPAGTKLGRTEDALLVPAGFIGNFRRFPRCRARVPRRGTL